jgi:hypothetical protein
VPGGGTIGYVHPDAQYYLEDPAHGVPDHLERLRWFALPHACLRAG